MKIDEIYRLLENFNEMRSTIGNAKIELSSGSRGMAMQRLEELEQKLQKCQKRVILETTIEAIKGGLTEL